MRILSEAGRKTRTWIGRQPRNLKIFHNKMPAVIKSLLDFFRFITEYGFLISVVMTFVFGAEFTVPRMFGYGILYYFIYYEVRAVITHWRGG